MNEKTTFKPGVVEQLPEDGYKSLIRYILPELVTAFLVYSLLNFVDATFIAHLKSTALYGVQGGMSTVVHFITKIAEGLSIGTVVVCGQYNGASRYHDAGRAAISSFWATLVIGIVIASALFFGASWLYGFFQFPVDMQVIGVQYLKIRAASVLLAFIYFSLIGFLRGIKRPDLSLKFFLLGAVVFIISDYFLIFGKFGMPALGLNGSAVAAVLQYSVMIVGALSYLLLNKSTRRYSLRIIKGVNKGDVKNIIQLSLPVMVDKATFAAAKIWLVKLITPMGPVALASFNVIKDMEQFAFVPAIACAQVVTFLVSNDYARGNWSSISRNIKRIFLLASISVFAILGAFAYKPNLIIGCFDKQNEFTFFAGKAFLLLSGLVICDLLQLILAGALRGAANVAVVMWTRIIVCLGFFVPVSYVLSLAFVENTLIKFVLIYGTFYVSSGLMGLVYVYWFRKDAWKYKSHFHTARVTHDKTSNLSRDSKTRGHIKDLH